MASDPQEPYVLVVDDEPKIRELVAMILEVHGFKVMTAAHGKEAMEMLQTRQPPCLILLDMTMPVMDGDAFVAACHADRALCAIPIVGITALGDGHRAASLRISSCLCKPIDMTLLIKTVERFCEKAA